MCRSSEYLRVVVQVPQVEVTDSVHTRKQSWVDGRPHDVIHVIRAVFKRVQRLIVLQERRDTAALIYSNERIFSRLLLREVCCNVLLDGNRKTCVHVVIYSNPGGFRACVSLTEFSNVHSKYKFF